MYCVFTDLVSTYFGFFAGNAQICKKIYFHFLLNHTALSVDAISWYNFN